MNKTCPHGEQFVACDKCDRDEARAEIASLESKLDSVTRERDLLAGAAESIHKSIDAYRTENDQLESRLDQRSNDLVDLMNKYHDKNEALHAAKSRLDSALALLRRVVDGETCMCDQYHGTEPHHSECIMVAAKALVVETTGRITNGPGPPG